MEYVTWKDKDTAVPSTTPESSKEYTVSNGKITVPIKITNVYNAYRIYVTPIIPQKPFGSEAIKLPGKIQAENYDVNGSGENNTSYYDADDENKGNVYREDGVDLEEIEEGNYVVGYTIAGEWLEYTVDVDADGEYPLTIRAAAGGTSGSVQLFVDGKAVTDTVAIPQTADNKWDVYENVDAGKVTLTVGEHIIKLAITGSYANIDWFMLGEIPQEIEEQDSIESLKEMNLRLDNGREAYTLFDMQGNRVGQFMAANLGEAYATASLQARKSGVYIIKSARGKALRISVKK